MKKNSMLKMATVVMLFLGTMAFGQLSNALQTFENDSTEVASSIISIVGGVFSAVCLVGLVFTFATGQQGEDKRNKLIGFGVGMLIFAAMFFLAKTLADLIQ